MMYESRVASMEYIRIEGVIASSQGSSHNGCNLKICARYSADNYISNIGDRDKTNSSVTGQVLYLPTWVSTR